MKNSVTLYTNTYALDSRTKAVKASLEPFQNLLDEVKALDVIKITSLEELKSVAREGEAYIKKRIEKEITAPSIGKFLFKKSVAVDMLDLPSFNDLNRLAKVCEQHLSDSQFLKLTSGKVEIDLDKFDQLFWNYSVTAETPEHIKLAEAHKKAAEALETLNESLRSVYKSNFMEGQSVFKTLFYIDTKGKVEYNPEFYRLNRLPA